MRRCYGRDERCTCDCYGCEANALPHCSRPRWTLRERWAAFVAWYLTFPR